MGHGTHHHKHKPKDPESPKKHRGSSKKARAPPEHETILRCKCKHHKCKWRTKRDIECDDGQARTVSWQKCRKEDARAFIRQYRAPRDGDGDGDESGEEEAGPGLLRIQQAQQAEEDEPQGEAAGSDPAQGPAPAEAEHRYAPGPQYRGGVAGAQKGMGYPQDTPFSGGFGGDQDTPLLGDCDGVVDMPASRGPRGGAVVPRAQSTEDGPVEAHDQWVDVRPENLYRPKETDGVVKGQAHTILPSVWSNTNYTKF